MTHAVALTGQWEGLRAFPRASRPPSTEFTRRRLQLGLERLEGLYERMAARASLLQQGMERLNGLRSGMIDQLDAIDGDPDFEPSLGVYWDGGWASDDRERDPCDLGEPDDDAEPSLCGVTVSLTAAMNQSDKEADLSWGGEYASTDQRYLYAAVEGDDNEDREPSLVMLDRHGGDQTGYRWVGAASSDDREADEQAEGELAYA